MQNTEKDSDNKHQTSHLSAGEIVKNWILIQQTPEDRRYMRPLFIFVLNQFEEIFKADFSEKELVLLYNDSQAPYPMFIISLQSLAVRTCAKNLSYWSQFVYQLSHEIMHYVIRQNRSNAKNQIRWFEETICEAMSLYILWNSSQKWMECALARNNPTYSESIKEYLYDVYSHTDKSALGNCHTLSELQKVEDSCCSKEGRLSRSQERNYLYGLFRENPEYLPIIVKYSNYTKDNLLLNLDSWRRDTGDEFILKLSSILPTLD